MSIKHGLESSSSTGTRDTPSPWGKIAARKTVRWGNYSVWESSTVIPPVGSDILCTKSVVFMIASDFPSLLAGDRLFNSSRQFARSNPAWAEECTARVGAPVIGHLMHPFEMISAPAWDAIPTGGPARG